jgi:Holliday junction resolvase RusA-like endonuclease
MKWKFPVQPVAASRPRVSRWGSYYTGKYKEFRQVAKPVMEDIVGDWEPTDKPLAVWLEVFPEKPKTSKLDYPRPDIDNYTKAVFDLCNELIWEDDSQVICFQAKKAWSKGTGYFTLEIEEL